MSAPVEDADALAIVEEETLRLAEQARTDTAQAVSSSDEDAFAVVEEERVRVGKLNQAGRVDPDEFAKRRELSERSGLSTYVLEGQEVRVEEELQSAELKAWSQSDDTPGVRDWMDRDPENAMLASDQIKELSNLERVMQKWSGSPRFKQQRFESSQLPSLARIGRFARDFGERIDLGYVTVDEAQLANRRAWATMGIGEFTDDDLLRTTQLAGDAAFLREISDPEASIFTPVGASLLVAEQLAQFTNTGYAQLKFGLLGGAGMAALALPTTPAGQAVAFGVGFTTLGKIATIKESIRIQTGFFYMGGLEAVPPNEDLPADSPLRGISALTFAIPAGLAEGLSFGNMTKGFTKVLRRKFGDMLKTAPNHPLVMAWAKEIATEGLTEGPIQEGLAIAQEIWLKHIGETGSLEEAADLYFTWETFEEIWMSEENLKRIGLSTAAGMIVSAPISGSANLVQHVAAVNQARSQGADNAGKFLGEFSDSVSALKELERRSKLHLRDSIDAAAANGGVKTIMIPADELNKLFQLDEAELNAIDIDEFFEGLPPEVRENFDAALREGGGDVEITLGAYATDILLTPMHAKVEPHIRLDDESFTATENEAYKAELKPALEAAGERAAALTEEQQVRSDRIHELAESIQNQISVASPQHGERATDTQATLIATYIVTLADLYGATTDEMLERIGGLQVLGFGTEPGELLGTRQRGVVLQPAVPQTPEFDEFIAGSQVVDESGAPLPVYHSTEGDFDELTPGGKDSTLSGPGIWFGSDPSQLNAAHNVNERRPDGARVIPAFLNLQNPAVIVFDEEASVYKDQDGNTYPDPFLLRNKPEMVERGFDGMIVHGPDNSTEYVAFESSQVFNALASAPQFQPAEPGEVVEPSASEPTEEQRTEAKADTRKSASIVAERLPIIIPESTRVTSSPYTVGTPDGKPWSSLTEAELAEAGPGSQLTQEELDSIMEEVLGEVSAAAQEAVDSTGARFSLTPEELNRALLLPLRAQLWYELSGERFRAGLPGLTRDQFLMFVDLIGATSARTEPLDNLARSLAVLSQSLQGAPIEVDLAMPTAVGRALDRAGRAVSNLLGNKTAMFSNTLALVGGHAVPYPIPVNDVWVGRMFGVTDAQLGANQSLHEVMGLYQIKLAERINAANPDAIPHQPWQIQSRTWVELRSTEKGIDTATAGAAGGNDYAMEWDTIVDMLRAGGIDIGEDGAITQEHLMDPKFANALRARLEGFQKAHKATVEFGTVVTKIGKRVRELFEQSVVAGNTINQKEYWASITTALYHSGRGKPTAWEDLYRVISGDRDGKLSRIVTPTKEGKFSVSGSFGGVLAPNIRVPLSGLTSRQLRQYNAVVGRALNQEAMAASRVVELDPSKPLEKGHTAGLSVFVAAKMDEAALQAFVDALPSGHDVSVRSVPNGFIIDVNPKYGKKGPEGLQSAAMLAALQGAGYDAATARVFAHDHSSEYTEAVDSETGETYDDIIQGLGEDITNDAAKELEALGIKPGLANRIAKARTPVRLLGSVPSNRRGRAKTVVKRLRERRDDLSSATKRFDGEAAKLDAKWDALIPKMEKRLGIEPEPEAPASPPKFSLPDDPDNVVSLDARRKDARDQKERILDEIRKQVTKAIEEMQAEATAEQVAAMDPDSVHSIGDRFSTDSNRLEILSYDRVDEDGTVHYNVRQHWPDGGTSEVTLTNENLEHATKMGGLESVKLSPDEEGGAGPRGFFQAGMPGVRENIIALGNSANLSTLLHEGGHFFMSVLETLAQQDDAPKQLRDDWNALLNFVGLKPGEPLIDRAKAAKANAKLEAAQLSGDKAAIRQAERELHIVNAKAEKLAKAFEQYLATGKAPSVELQSAFAKFQAWFMNLYEDIKTLTGRELPSDITEVFDRLLATKEQIAEVRAANNMGPLFVDMSGMSDGEKAQYQASLERVEEDANRQMLKDALKDAKKEVEAEREAERVQVREQVEAELRKSPIHQARQWLATGEWIGDDSDDPGLDHSKLDRAALIEEFGERVVRDLPGRQNGVVAGKKVTGIVHWIAAQAFGLTPTELIEGLKTTPLLEQAIEEMTDQVMARRNTEPDTVEQRALDALHGEPQANHLILEIKILRDMKARELAAKGAERDVAEEGARSPESRDDAVAAAEAEVTAAQEALGDLTGESDPSALNLAQQRVTSAVVALQAAQERTKAARPARRAERASRRQAAGLKVELKATRDQAEADIAKIPLGRLRPNRYSANERRAAEKSRRAVAERDLEAALLAKRDQLYNHFAYRAARKALARKDTIVKRTRRITKPKNLLRVKAGGLEFFNHILALAINSKLIKTKRQAPVPVDSLRAFTVELQKNGEDIAYDVDRVEAAMTFGDWKMMSLRELEQLDIALVNLNHMATVANEIRIGDAKRSLDEQKQLMIDRIEKVHGVEEELAEGEVRHIGGKYVGESLVSGVMTMHAWLTKMETFAIWLDGGVEGGPNWQMFGKLARDAQFEEDQIKGDFAEDINELMKAYKLTEWQKARTRFSAMSIPEAGVSLTHEARIVIGFNLGNQGNRDALMFGYGWTEEQLAAIAATLTDRDIDFIESVWEMLEKRWPMIAQHSQAMTGIQAGKVPTDNYVMPNGRVLKGGYFPLVADPDATVRALALKEKATVNEMFGGSFASSQTAHSHDHARSGWPKDGSMKVLLSMDVLYRHMNEVAHDLAQRKYILNVVKILDDPAYIKAVEHAAGPEMQRMMRPWAQRIAAEAIDIMDPITKAVRVARMGQNAAVIGLSLTTVIQQPSAILPVAALVGTRNTTLAIQAFTQNYNESMAFAMERSKELPSRRRTRDRDINDASSKLSADSQRKEMIKFGYVMVGEVDAITAAVAWMAAYLHGGELYRNDEQAAIDYADSIVSRTQGSAAPKDLARIQSGNEFSKNMTRFYTFFSAQYNLFFEFWSKFKKFKTISRTEFFAAMIMTFVIPPLLNDLLLGRTPEKDDDDPLKWIKWAGWSVLGNFATSVPVVGNIVSSAKNGFGFSILAGESSVDQAVTSVMRLGKINEDGLLESGVLQAGGKAVGSVLGVPVNQLNRIQRAYLLYLDEGRVDISLAMFGREQDFFDNF